MAKKKANDAKKKANDAKKKANDAKKAQNKSPAPAQVSSSVKPSPAGFSLSGKLPTVPPASKAPTKLKQLEKVKPATQKQQAKITKQVTKQVTKENPNLKGNDLKQAIQKGVGSIINQPRRETLVQGLQIAGKDGKLSWKEAGKISQKSGANLNKVYNKAGKKDIAGDPKETMKKALKSGIFGNNLNLGEMLGIAKLYDKTGQQIVNHADKFGLGINIPDKLAQGLNKGRGTYLGASVGYREASLLGSKPVYDKSIDRVYQKADNLGFQTVVGKSAAQAGYVPKLDSTVWLPGYDKNLTSKPSGGGGGGYSPPAPPVFQPPETVAPSPVAPTAPEVDVEIDEYGNPIASQFAGRGGVKRRRRSNTAGLATRSALSISGGGPSSAAPSIGGLQLSL